MKKHLSSIQSTHHGEQMSIFSYDDRQMKLNYKTQILKLFTELHSVLTLRSYLLFRDIQQIFENCETFFLKTLRVTTGKQLFSFAFPKKKEQQKLYEKDILAFLVKIVLEIDKMRKEAASEGRTKDFETLKKTMEFLQEKITQYQQAIRKKKHGDKIQRQLKEHQQKQSSFKKFQQQVRQNLIAKQQQLRTSFLEKIHLDDELSFTQTQAATARHMYKAQPSKLLSEAKDLSLRVKLSPYASELKRNYDYKTLEDSLTKTLDLDMGRKLSVIAHMKRVEKEKLNKNHTRRYSVMEDRLGKEKKFTEKQLVNQRHDMQKSLQIGLQKLNKKSISKENARTQSLQKSFNAFNMHSDTKQISKIIRNHKETIQFSNNISEVANLRTINSYEPVYSTIASQMNFQDSMKKEKLRQGQHEKRILRRFHNSIKQIDRDGDSDEEADNLCGTNAKTGRMERQKSLVALYDNELKETK